MKRRCFLLKLFIIGVLSIFSREVMAFSCTSNGVSIGGAGTFTIPVDIVLSKDTDSIILTDMSAYTTCNGNAGYLDALRTTSASISPLLTALGYSGFVDINGARYTIPIGVRCVWVNASCTPFSGSYPLRVKIGMQRQTSVIPTGTTIPAGTEIARLSVQQRSNLGITGGTQYWQWDKTWIFTSKNALVIPAYTCSVNNLNQTVTLLPVRKTDLINSGSGKYPDATPFKINLSCEPETTVSVKFEGATMSGKTDVLSNTSSGNENVGLQMYFKNNPIILGQTFRAIDNAQGQEQLSFNAYYYYNGASNITAGNVTAVTTFTLTYQ